MRCQHVERAFGTNHIKLWEIYVAPFESLSKACELL